MNKPKHFLIVSLLTIVFLSGCNASAKPAGIDLFQYKDAYVGDNSAIINTVNQLPGADYFNELELKTKDEPYGIMLNYDWTESALDVKETTITNATYLFTLVQNVTWINFHFEMIDDVYEYKVTSEDIEDWYGTDISKIDNEAQLNELIQELLEDDEKVNGLLD